MNDVKPRRGRPANPRLRTAILSAATDLLSAHGLGAVTVEAVAARAQVGKPTIYRYFANAQELTLAALVADAPDTEVAATANAVADLVRQINRVAQAFATPRGRQAAMMIASADAESETGKALRSQVLLRSREEGRAILERAAYEGRLRPDADREVVLDMLYGSVFYRLLLRQAPPDLHLVRESIDVVMRGVASASIAADRRSD
jgi:AcrR family transcriptional regulator